MTDKDESFDYREEASQNSDQEYDKVLRPRTLSDFAGQPSVVQNLEILSVFFTLIFILQIYSYLSKVLHHKVML